MDALEVMDMHQMDEQKLYKNIFSLLSFEKITFNGTLTSFVKLVFNTGCAFFVVVFEILMTRNS